MTMEPQDMTDDQLQKAVGLAYNAEKLAKKQLADLKKEWLRRQGNTVGTQYEAEGVSVHLSDNARWDEATARRVLADMKIPADVIAKMEITVLDRKEAEDKLPPRVYRMCQKAHGTRFNVNFT